MNLPRGLVCGSILMLGLAAACTAAGSDAGPNSATTAEDRGFWAFQPPREVSLPAVKNTAWPKGPVDYFVLAALEARGLSPAPPAEKHALARRATFDLHGLPPTPEEVDAFVADTSPDAFARFVDRLLASPRYGERWGRHWLDVARYADSNGMDENMAMAHAWRYRDFVIGALNDDMPYDQFIREQLAGDLLESPDEATRYRRLIATGFLVLGAKMLAEDDPVKMEMDIIDEQVDTIGRALMGLTLGCARCHDHKFDPIPTSDYYSLAGIFKSTKTMENFRVVAMWAQRPLADAEQTDRLAAQEAQIARVSTEVQSAEAEVKKNDSAELKDSLVKLKSKLEALKNGKLELPQALAVSDREPRNLRVHLRGSHLSLGDEAPRRFPRLLAGDAQQPISDSRSGRLELANWLACRDHPLTSRVMVNRIWQAHFGEGLVRSSDNFGQLGELPDNQPLLDWLARQLVGGGWSIKAMHRLIMLTSAYQMSTSYDPRAARLDPENRLLWRMNRRRLEAEEIRDAILCVSGQLDCSMGGTLLAHKNHTMVTSTASTNDVNYESRRRSVYLPVVRSAIYEMFQAFDFADPSTMNGKRSTTTVAPQALFMMNSPLVRAQTRIMAERLVGDTSLDDAGRLDVIFMRAYSRAPSLPELKRSLDFIAAYQSDLAGQNIVDHEARLRAWQALCRVILSANEFVYVE